jgi:hypothetical protein
MARKLTDIAHVNLRIRETLRRKLEREAARHETSMNNEIRVRLERSFELEAIRELDEIAKDYKWRADVENREARHGSLLVAAENLVAAVERKDQGAIDAAIGTVKTVAKTIDIEAALAKRGVRS